MVTPVHLFALAARHAEWASARQAVVTGNIANANTTGYTALDIQPFSDVLDRTGMQMASTEAGHFASGSGDTHEKAWTVSDTGRGVALDQELMKAGEVNRGYALDTTIMSSFHRMLMASVRST